MFAVRSHLRMLRKLGPEEWALRDSDPRFQVAVN
jgi:hypothetical protein